MQRPQDERDRGRKRLVIIVGAAILLMIGGVVGYGFYDRFVAPSNVLAARVGDTRYTQGDLVKRLRMLQTGYSALGQRFDSGREPFQILRGLAEAEIIRRAAPRYGIQVTDSDVDAYLRQKFYPEIPEGQEAVPGQVEQEYRQNYQNFLNSSHLSKKDYRQIVLENRYRVKLREKLGEQVPSIAEQVEVQWITFPSDLTPSPEGSTGPTPEEILLRLEVEDFGDVAKEVSTDTRYANRSGNVGWVPQGAFPTLDDDLYGGDEQERLALNEISNPIYAAEGTYILKVTAGPEEREISAIMRERLKDQAMQKWLQEETARGTREGWVEMKFDSKIYEWVIKQVREAAPPAPPTPTGG